MQESNPYILSFGSYHTLADDHRRVVALCSSLVQSWGQTMTKAEVLSIFDRSGEFLTPDRVCLKLQPRPDRRSAYSYLLRLSRQGLLERNHARRGHLAYRLTDRGRQRLAYLRRAR
jgi:Fe2+ or Zn2+ uptake regulation protein